MKWSVCIQVFIASDAEWYRAILRSRGFSRGFIWDFTTTQYLRNYWFFWYDSWHKKCLFLTIWSKSMMSRLSHSDLVGLFLSQSKIYKFEILTQFVYRFFNCHIKFWSRNPHWFWKKIAFLVNQIFAIFSFIFAYNSRITYYFQILIVWHERTSQVLSE